MRSGSRLYNPEQLVESEEENPAENRVEVPIPGVEQEQHKEDYIEMVCVVEDLEFPSSYLRKRCDPNH